MLRTTLKNVFAHKARLALTALAIIFGVGFVAGTFIFTDTIGATFDNLFDDVFEGTDVIVQSEQEFSAGFDGPPPFDEELLQTVQSVDGVRAAEGTVGGYAQIIDKDGDAIQPQGPPTIGTSWNVDEQLQGNTELRAGRAPQVPGEIAIDAKTSNDNDLNPGDVVDVLIPIGREQFEIVGVVGFGESDNLAGATLTLFEISEAQRVLDVSGQFTGITVSAESGIDASTLALRIGTAMPEGIEAVAAADEAAQASEDLSDSLGFLQTVLLVFAAISVFVGAFIIQNTFRIVVAQRTKEMGLLRAVGATGGQVIRMVLVEALIVAVIGSALGLLFGFAISGGLTALMSGLGFDLPSTSQQLALRTILWGFGVGIVVTILSALLPAIKAARVPPIAAMQDVDTEPTGSLSRRAIVGGSIAFLGALVTADGLFEWGIVPFSTLIAVGVGVLLIFVGVSIFSVLFIQPLTKVIGAPMASWSKVSGRLAQDNAIRRPRRTAATASALMIGLALVGFFFILGESIKASTTAAIEEGLRADYVISVEGFANGFPTALAEELEAAPELASVTELRLGFWDNDGTDDFLIGLDTGTVEDTIFLDIQEGTVAGLASGGVFVHDDAADSNDYVVGDTVPMGFSATGLVEAEVVGIFSEINVVQASYVSGLAFYEENFSAQLDFVIAIKAADGVATDAARSIVEGAAAAYPNVKVEDQAEYRQSQEEQINTLLNLFNGLLGLAVIIALLGITNTLVLSIIERTREVGLLRAVGMSRWQVRRMVLWESIMVAVIGGVFGLVLGVIFGVVLVQALADQGIDTLAIPGGQLVFLLVFSAFVGVMAGLWPARKAAKLNILEAIAYE